MTVATADMTRPVDHHVNSYIKVMTNTERANQPNGDHIDRLALDSDTRQEFHENVDVELIQRFFLQT